MSSSARILAGLSLVIAFVSTIYFVDARRGPASSPHAAVATNGQPSDLTWG
ncbi:hypothetical protein KDL01_07040 [Actinospica durhamensis]|uniref:Uncharacterized protein n=1 Tax=Actinospica durhamensis TaxID=1508375 RepID=A0A941EKH4_9ACTN|nr:hypothetical protein [Actinospica durhamensis]MBR7833011.1 hypothetical protein [Actinospica durhamensis]